MATINDSITKSHLIRAEEKQKILYNPRLIKTPDPQITLQSWFNFILYEQFDYYSWLNSTQKKINDRVQL